MATYTCQTSRWVSTSPFVELRVDVTTNATQAIFSYRLTYYSDNGTANATAPKSYSVSIGGQEVESGTCYINGKDIFDVCEGTVTIAKTKAQQTITCSCSFGFNLTWSGVYGGTKSASTTISIAAKDKYAITYNANGGSGAPVTHYKWHGESTTLSSTKPVKTGHTFKGWTTSAGKTYQPKASYTDNAALSLSAIWEANEYPVTYNANGGSGAPAAQTKKHGENLTLTSSISNLKRTNYTFKGWATSANGAVSYQPGGAYTANNAITLYAVWELSYVHPKIYNAHAEWSSGQDGTNLLSNSAGPFVSGTDSNYGHQSILPNTVYPNGYSTMFPTGKIYTLMFDWSVNWGSIAPVTDVQVRIGYGEDSGSDSYEGKCASMSIPNLATATSGSVSFTFTFTSIYGTESGMAIHPIYHSSKDALDGATWTISNVRLVEGDGSDIISVVFDWETTNSDPTGNLAFYDAGGSEVHSVSLGQLSGKSGHFESTISVAEATSLNIDTSYVIKITLSDGGGDTTSTVTLTGNIYPIDFLAGGKGVSFGGPASLEDTAHFQWDAKFDKSVCGNVPGMYRLPEIPANDDFNNYITTGCWAVYKNANAETIANIPVARAGRLEVWSATGEGIRAEQWSYLRQRFIPYNNANATWERDIARGEDNVWRYYEWHRTTLTPVASEKIYSKAAITAILNANKTLGVLNTYTKIPIGSLYGRAGDRISINNGNITIGKNISTVKVSGQTLVKCGNTAGNRHARLQRVRGGSTLNFAWNCLYATAESNMVLSFAPIILGVQEGDVIQMVFYTSNVDDSNQAGSGANGYQTYLTVEEL